MSKSDVFHLGLTKNDLQGATLAIVPGDPERVEKIAALMDKPVKLASHREFTSWRAELDGKPVIVCSTGIGGPSTSIAVEELAQLGVRTSCALAPPAPFSRTSTLAMCWSPPPPCVWTAPACTSRRWNSRPSQISPAPPRWWKRRNPLAPPPISRDRLLGYFLPGPGALRHLLRSRGEPLQRLYGRVAGDGRDEL